MGEKVYIRVGGMSCAMCAKAVESALTRIEGVTSAEINLTTEKVLIISEVPIPYEILKKSIEDAGYTWIGIQEDPEKVELEKKKLLAFRLRRVIVGFVFGFSMMAQMHLKIDLGVDMAWLHFIVGTPVFFFLSYPILKAAYRALKNLTLNMEVMYSMGIVTAYIASVMATFRFVLTRDFLFFDTAIMLSAFLMLGKYLEQRAKGRTSDAIKKLIELRPKTAIVLKDGVESEVPVDSVFPGDIVVVKPGSGIPLDGEVVNGESWVDESMISGEPIPVHKRAGSSVTGGTLNGKGLFNFKVLKVGRETVLAQIIRLVEEAQASRPPVQRIADRVVSWFIPLSFRWRFSPSVPGSSFSTSRCFFPSPL